MKIDRAGDDEFAWPGRDKEGRGCMQCNLPLTHKEPKKLAKLEKPTENRRGQSY